MRKRREVPVEEKIEHNPKMKLRKQIHEIKVENLVKNFVRKISMNNTEKEPVDYDPFENKVEKIESWME